MSMELTNTDLSKPLNFPAKTRKKNGYRKLEPGAYPRMFRRQVKSNVAAFEDDDLQAASMVRLDERTGHYLVSFGFGKRNTWFQNDRIQRGCVWEFKHADEVRELLRTILKAAKTGEFDKALNKLCEDRQEHANTMIVARSVDGFVPPKQKDSEAHGESE